MTMLLIEYPIKDFTKWKKLFDSDPAGRRALGVRRHSVYRPTARDDNTVVVEFQFDSRVAAEHGHAALEEQWSGAAAAPVLAGPPSLHIVDLVEDMRY